KERSSSIPVMPMNSARTQRRRTASRRTWRATSKSIMSGRLLHGLDEDLLEIPQLGGQAHQQGTGLPRPVQLHVETLGVRGLELPAPGVLRLEAQRQQCLPGRALGEAQRPAGAGLAQRLQRPFEDQLPAVEDSDA